MTSTGRRSLRAGVRRVPGARRAITAVRTTHRRVHALARDLRGRASGGRDAPRYAERVTIDPASCDEAIVDDDRVLDRRMSGRVLRGDWDLPRVQVGSLPKVAACYRHWVDGVPWDETGVYDEMMRIIADRPGADGCRTIDDVVARYAQLDSVFEHVRAEGRLRSARDFGPGLREEHGVYVHFDRSGRPVFGGGGMHRLAIARILELPSIPAQVGVVHRDGLAHWRDGLADALSA